uniref:Uncharacterized protein n=1 Tax=Spongospora subterranea TaxID=70186 RepID=A0A0H5RPC6_9EUKA|eukprot:CRZ10574.1 hypothetical protein [Spongospora subterranea]
MEPYASSMEPNFIYESQPASLITPFQPIPQFPGSSVPHDRPMVPTQARGANSVPYPLPQPITTLVRQMHTKRFRLLLPDLSSQNECHLCQDPIQTVLAETTFRCCMSLGLKNLRDKPNNLCISLIDDGLDFKIPFKVYAPSTIKRGRSSLRRNCLVFVIAPQLVAHLFCRTPLVSRGSIKWTEGQEPFAAFEDEMGYVLRIISTPEMGAVRVALSLDVTSNLLQDDIIEDMASSDSNQQNTSSSHAGVDDSIAGVASGPGRERCLIPDLTLKANTSCRGFRIASYSFQMQMMTSTSKNLRQRACSFDIFIRNRNGLSENDPEYNNFTDVVPFRIKWKVYADSTIKRGKKSLRRNDFVFPIDDDHVLIVFCQTPPQFGNERLALKWTEEKQEQFLAFESGLQFGIQIYSRERSDNAQIIRNKSSDDDERIANWQDDICPDREIAPRVEHPIVSAASLWHIHPNIWNMSMNTGSKFFVMITCPLTRQLPRDCLVQLHLQDKAIVAEIAQIDERTRRSIMVSMPAVFSQEKVLQATTTGIQMERLVDLSILAGPEGATIWKTTFIYEIGHR